MPSLAPFYTQWEADFDAAPGVAFAGAHWEVPLVAVCAYLLVCYFGTRIMAKRQRFDLRYPLVAWNFFLAIFSFMGAVRTVPHMLYILRTRTIRESICQPGAEEWGSGATGLWVQLFIFSKIPELVDTLFIVLRQRPYVAGVVRCRFFWRGVAATVHTLTRTRSRSRSLIFLHWYHHVTVLLYCWHAYATEAGAGLYFVSMNFTVHAIMYFYYALMALRVVPTWFPSWIITTLQLSQMVVGTAVCAASWYYVTQQPETPCANTLGNLIAGGLMYGSYLYLFLEFFVRRFILGDKKAKGE